MILWCETVHMSSSLLSACMRVCVCVWVVGGSWAVCENVAG